MSTTKKILKNNTEESIQILNQDVAPDAEYDVPHGQWHKLADDPNIPTKISDGDIIVNDGDSDLSIASALRHIALASKILIEYDDSSVAKYINTINFEGDVSITDNGNGKITVGVSSSGNIATHIFDTSFVENGSAQNKWLDNNCQNVNSNETLFTIPFDCRIIGITFSNSRNGADCDIEIYKSTKNNGVSDKTKIYTWELRNKRTGYKNNFTNNIDLNSGDKIAVYLKDQGTNAMDPVFNIYFQILNNNKGENSEDFSGDF